MSTPAPEKTQPSKEELAKAQKEAPLLLSQAIKELLDDDHEGGIFYAHIIQQMCRNFDDPRVPTAAVSVTDKINLYVNSWFWCKELKTEKQRAAVLKHEVLHLIFDHCSRCLDFGDRKLSNIAADLVVNSQINPALFGEMAKDLLFPANFKLPHDETLEFYYKNFPIHENPNYKEFDTHSVWSEQEGEQISDQMKKSLVKDAVLRASETVSHTGNLPSAVKQIVALAKEKPQIPWELILRQFISRVAGGTLKHTIKRISKRFKMRPGPRIYPRLKILVAVDVSGSVYDEVYQMFFDEVMSIARNVGKVDIVEFDAAICSVYTVTKTTPKVTRSGNGGNDLRPVIKWLQQHKQNYDGVIWFTDGEFCGFPPPPKLGIPSIWVLNPDGTDRDLKTYRVIKLPRKKAEK